MTSDKRILVAISGFIVLIFVRNIAFWSQEHTFIFGDTAVYALYLTALSKNLLTIFSPVNNFLFWNLNYLSVGMPTLSIIDMGYLYPPNLALVFIARVLNNDFLIFPLISLSALFHLAFGAFFIHKILKEHWKLNEFSSLIGGLLWVFIGFNVEYTTANSVLFSGSYLPLCFYLNLKYKESGSTKYFILYCIFLALSFLVGYPMPAVIIFFTCLFYNLLIPNSDNKLKTFSRVGLEQIKGFFLITFPIISPLYFSSIRSFSGSFRGTVLPLEVFLGNTVNLSNFAESLLPRNTPFNIASTTNIIHIYVSIVALIIFLQARHKKDIFNDSRNRTLVILGLIGTILALGGVTAIPTLVYLTAPVISFFRRLNVFSLISGFAICILIPQFLSDAFRQRNLSGSLVFGIKIIVVLLLFTQTLRILYDDSNHPSVDYKALLQSVCIVIIIGTITIISLLSYHYNSNFAKALLLFALLVEAGTVIASRAYLNSKTNPADIFRPNDLSKYLQQILKPEERVDLQNTQYNYSTDHLGIEQTAGYVALASKYGVRLNEILPLPQSSIDLKNLRDILGIRYIVKKGDYKDTTLEEVKKIGQGLQKPNFYSFDYDSLSWKPDPIETYYTIYKNPTALPRLYLASGIIPLENQSKFLLPYFKNLKDSKIVFLNAKDLQKDQIDPNGKIEMLEYKRNYIKAKINSEDSAFLANSTGYYPNWIAKINGKEIKPVQTNWFMMGIFLPKGESTVEFIYMPYEINASILYIISVSIYWTFYKFIYAKAKQR